MCLPEAIKYHSDLLICHHYLYCFLCNFDLLVEFVCVFRNSNDCLRLLQFIEELLNIKINVIDSRYAVLICTQLLDRPKIKKATQIFTKQNIYL